MRYGLGKNVQCRSSPAFLLNLLMDSVLKQNMIKRDVLPDLINNHQQI